jgi:FkbM family methyltransferase
MSTLSRWLRGDEPKPPPLPPTPYEHLLLAPRFDVRAEQLLGRPFYIADTLSFYSSFREIFQQEIYRFHATSHAPVIVDCGANYGVSVVYFKQIFPDAKVIAVEADPEIFALLQWNVAVHDLADVTLINKVVAAQAGQVQFHREGADAGRMHFMAGAKGVLTLPTIALDELLTQSVDFLKIDIEGAETEVLAASRRLDRVGQLMVEYHSFADSPQELPRLLSALTEAGFRYYVQTQYCPRQPLTKTTAHLGMDLQLNIFAKRPGATVAVEGQPALPPEAAVVSRRVA